jgi:hypothetical protein
VKRSKNGYLLFWALLAALHSVGQVKMLELEEVLKTLADKHQVGFTYADRHVKNVLVAPPPGQFSLLQSLAYLQSATRLTFEIISPRQVVISKTETPQTICGRVASKSSLEKLPGVVVWTAGAHAVSDEEGFFELAEVPPDAQISFRLLGYHSVTQGVAFFDRAAGDRCPMVFLDEQVVVMDEMTIRNYVARGIDKKADGAFDIQPGGLGILPGLPEPDVLQTVQALPGIRSFNESIADINVRGGTHDQNLILWDGIKMYQTGHFFGLISAFNPYLTEKITFIKNGSSAFWGDGVSSIIDLRSGDQPLDKVSGSAGLNLLHADGILKIPFTKKSNLHISGRHSLSGLQTPTYRRYFERSFNQTDVTNAAKRIDSVVGKNERFNFYDVSLKYLHDFSAAGKLRINLLHMKNKVSYAEDVLIRNYLESRTTFVSQQSTGGSMEYSHLWSSRFRSAVQAYVSQYQLASVDYNIPFNQRLRQKNGVLDIGIKADSRVSLSPVSDLFFGYQFYEVGVRNLEEVNNPAFRRDRRNVLLNHAAFAEYAFYTRDSRTNVRAGLRVSHFPALRQTLPEPRIAASHTLFENFVVELLAERKSQVTTQVIDLQNDFLGVERRRWILSNEKDVPIIISNQFSAGLHFRKPDFLVSLEGYHKVVDGITTSSQGFQNQFQFVRASGRYRIYGFDFLINRRVGLFNGWFTYSLSRNTYRFDGLTPPVFRSNLDVRSMAAVGLSAEKKRWAASAGLHYHSGRPFTRPVSPEEIINNNIIYEFPNRANLRPFWRLDFAVKYSFTFGALPVQTGLSVWNALNRTNEIDTHFFINDRGEIDSRTRYALAATLNAFMRVNF